MNIYCIGRNFALHAHELGNQIPDSPVVFLKPNTAISYATSVHLPAHLGQIEHELEPVVRLNAHIDNARHTWTDEDWLDCIDALALGIDFTARTYQNTLKAQGLPWLLAKGFKNSAWLSAWIPFKRTPYQFSLHKNGELVQQGDSRQMIFSIGQILAFLAQNFCLVPDDIIFLGTPSGVGVVQDGDNLTMALYQNDRPFICQSIQIYQDVSMHHNARIEHP